MDRKQLLIKSIVLCFVICSASVAAAQDVSARLSSKEAYVGNPIILQIQINNATDFTLPEKIAIEGCKVQKAGTPSQSSRITIINGRRSESRSITMQYLITPLKPGTFTVPRLKVIVNQNIKQTLPQTFVATKSETGDLLFVEISGSKESVYVGEALELTLKIWLKPYRHNQINLVLSEGQMWQLLSDQTSWGPFAEQIDELAEQRERPVGKEVIREDGEGNPRSYYLYEVKTKIYPTRPGNIDASDIQIVFNYPTSIGRSRDPFDDFFGAPFGRTLTIDSARPILGEAKVDSTEVKPIPTEGKPKDYRGAIGEFKIITDAEPTTIDAGDPITLHMGIVGTGLMERVQAPPLSEIEEISNDFKVADQSLAGFVRDNTKIFATTIRPREAGITEVPPIPFSYFDPNSESFKTVYSKPIPITVNEAETLSLDSIVSNVDRTDSKNIDGKLTHSDSAVLDFTNHYSISLTNSQSPYQPMNTWWFYCLVIPPTIWLCIIFVHISRLFFRLLRKFRPANTICEELISKSESIEDLKHALIGYVTANTKQSCNTEQQAVGSLRSLGLNEIANQLESFFQSIGTAYESEAEFVEHKNNSYLMLKDLSKSFSSRSGVNVRKSHKRLKDSKIKQYVSCFLFSIIPVTVEATQNISLPQSQQETIFQEANTAYKAAQSGSQTDQAELKELYEEAAKKYQILIDAGVSNSLLYINQANSYLKIGQKSKALANYYRALKLEPSNSQAINNMRMIQANAETPNKPLAKNTTEKVLAQLEKINDVVISVLGIRLVQFTLAFSSIAFWLVIIFRTCKYQFPFWRSLIVPLVLLVISSITLFLEYQSFEVREGVIVVDQLLLREEDDLNSHTVHSLKNADGSLVKILSQRLGWTKIETDTGQQGWVTDESLEKI